MKIKTIINGFFFGNCYLVWGNERECIIIDPGDEDELINRTIQELGLFPKLIIGTHVNIDSIGAAASLQEIFKVPFAIHHEDAKMMEFMPKMARFLGLPQIKIPAVDKWLNDGEIVKAGEIEFKVIHTPGHTPGSICLYTPGVLFTGDTLIAGSYGRTDLKWGNERAILESIQDKLFILDDNTIVYPGHGPSTSIGNEKKKNWAIWRRISQV